MISWLHQLLPGLIPGGAKKALSAAQAKTLLAAVRPRDPAGQARRRVAAELISDLERIHQRKKAADKELRDLLKGHRHHPDQPQRDRPLRCRPAPGRSRRPSQVPGKAHFASWKWHRADRRVLRRPGPPPPVPGREPADQPHPAHHGCRPAPPPRQRGTGLLRPQSRRREDPQGSDEIPQTPALRHRLPPDDPRRPRQESGPGRTPGGGYWLQRGRLAPRCRHFREVTSRTRHQRPCPSQAGPFFRSFRRPGPTPDRSGEDRHTLPRAETTPLTQRGARSGFFPSTTVPALMTVSLGRADVIRGLNQMTDAEDRDYLARRGAPVRSARAQTAQGG